MYDPDEIDKIVSLLFSHNHESRVLGISMLFERRYTIYGIYNLIKHVIEFKLEHALETTPIELNKPVVYINILLADESHENAKFLSFVVSGKREGRTTVNNVEQVTVHNHYHADKDYALLHQEYREYNKDRFFVFSPEKAREIARLFIKQMSNHEREILSYLKSLTE